MAYLDDEQGGGGRSLGAKVAGVLAIAAAVMIVRYATTGTIFGGRSGSGSGGMTPERVDRELLTHRDAGELYRTVKATYPGEYQAFIRRVSTVARTGSSAAVEAEAFNFARQLTIDHFDGFARAPSDRIVAVARQYSLLIGALQRADVALCAQFVTAGFRPGARPPREATAILSRIAIMQIQASRAGETRPRDPRTELSEQEGAVFFREIERRSPSAGRLLSDQRALAAAPPDQQCAAGLAIHEAILILPDDAAAKVTVNLLRQSFGAAGAAGN